MSLFSLIERSLRDNLTEVSSYLTGQLQGGQVWQAQAGLCRQSGEYCPERFYTWMISILRQAKPQQTWTKVVLLWAGAWTTDFQNFMLSNLLGSPASMAAQSDHSSSVMLCPCCAQLTGWLGPMGMGAGLVGHLKEKPPWIDPVFPYYWKRW